MSALLARLAEAVLSAPPLVWEPEPVEEARDTPPEPIGWFDLRETSSRV